MVDFSQWPLVALVVMVATPFLVYIRAQNEAHIKYVKDQCTKWEVASNENTAILRQLTATVVQLTATVDKLSERLETRL